MKKVYRLIDLDCANCAAKMERAIAGIDGVNYVNVAFMAQRLTVDISDDAFDSVMNKVIKVCKKVEPDCTIVM